MNMDVNDIIIKRYPEQSTRKLLEGQLDYMVANAIGKLSKFVDYQIRTLKTDASVLLSAILFVVMLHEDEITKLIQTDKGKAAWSKFQAEITKLAKIKSKEFGKALQTKVIETVDPMLDNNYNNLSDPAVTKRLQSPFLNDSRTAEEKFLIARITHEAEYERFNREYRKACEKLIEFIDFEFNNKDEFANIPLSVIYRVLYLESYILQDVLSSEGFLKAGIVNCIIYAEDMVKRQRQRRSTSAKSE